MATVSNRTLRYYEELGLITPKSRGSNKYRYYDEEHLQRLQTIKMLQEAGFALKEIVAAFAPILDPQGNIPSSGQEMARKIFQALEAQRKTILERQSELQKALQSLQATLNHLQECFGCKVSANLEDCGNCEHGAKEVSALSRDIFGSGNSATNVKTPCQNGQGRKNDFVSPSAATYMMNSRNPTATSSASSSSNGEVK